MPGRILAWCRTPTLDDIYESFTSPYLGGLSLDLAAAHLLALGADGPALRELAALSERDFGAALELLPAAQQEAGHLLSPVHALRIARDDELDVGADAVVIVWAASSIGDRIDDVGAFLDDLSRAAAVAGLGEVDGPVDEAEEQVAFCYGEDLQALRAFVAARLQDAPLPPARLEIRSGPGGSPPSAADENVEPAP